MIEDQGAIVGHRAAGELLTRAAVADLQSAYGVDRRTARKCVGTGQGQRAAAGDRQADLLIAAAQAVLDHAAESRRGRTADCQQRAGTGAAVADRLCGGRGPAAHHQTAELLVTAGQVERGSRTRAPQRDDPCYGQHVGRAQGKRAALHQGPARIVVAAVVADRQHTAAVHRHGGQPGDLARSSQRVVIAARDEDRSGRHGLADGHARLAAGIAEDDVVGNDERIGAVLQVGPSVV